MASATTTKGATGRSPLSVLLFYVFLVLFVLVSMFPLLWVFRMSIVTKADLLESPTVTATAPPVVESYKTVFGNPEFVQALVNSMIVAGTTTVICLFFGSICAYSIARLRFRFKSPIMTLILAISF
ncbi:MAG: carbohydrate ABC transporter permease, partial [Actinomycetota bacterium]|nr:carbohydrate ABC transporter permease [Actinomycetota bacterium]